MKTFIVEADRFRIGEVIADTYARTLEELINKGFGTTKIKVRRK